jgi:hypothetical protein
VSDSSVSRAPFIAGKRSSVSKARSRSVTTEPSENSSSRAGGEVLTQITETGSALATATQKGSIKNAVAARRCNFGFDIARSLSRMPNTLRSLRRICGRPPCACASLRHRTAAIARFDSDAPGNSFWRDRGNGSVCVRGKLCLTFGPYQFACATGRSPARCCWHLMPRAVFTGQTM